jgi:hypothetical protein
MRVSLLGSHRFAVPCPPDDLTDQMPRELGRIPEDFSDSWFTAIQIGAIASASTEVTYSRTLDLPEPIGPRP